ncbi:unnamed protein product [Phyllotreta striolata]|uniref:Uncharacterized protein n=1 Tax=Phyllotreta striolata TaxID=444603 RepID=A0A9P0GL10_PHYSR|nr:unnamed protein product [Phyllotreta striolata]
MPKNYIPSNISKMNQSKIEGCDQKMYGKYAVNSEKKTASKTRTINECKEKCTRRPSLIPKLFRSNQYYKTSYSSRNSSHISSPKAEFIDRRPQLQKSKEKDHAPTLTKILTLEEELKKTIKICNKKHRFSSVTKTSPTYCDRDNPMQTINKIKILFNNIKQIKNTATLLADNIDFREQKKYIQNLIRCFGEIQGIVQTDAEINSNKTDLDNDFNMLVILEVIREIIDSVHDTEKP